MFKSGVLLCVAFCVVIEARPWQFLPAVPGYVPVYIQTGDTPLEQINPELAEAFHALPSGRSVSKQIDASPEEMADQPRDEIADQPTDEIAEQPKDEIAEQPKDEIAEQRTDEIAEQPTDEIAEQPTDEIADQPTDKIAEQPTDKIAEQPRDEMLVSADDTVDHRPYAKKLLEKKKKVNSEVTHPIERR